MADVKYIMDCGCECTRKEVTTRNMKNDDGTRVQRYVCKKCGGVVIARKIVCRDCGNTVIFGLNGRVKQRCDDCLGNVGVVKLQQLRIEASRSRYDCKNRSQCLNRYSTRHDQIEPKCIEEYYQCKKYESVPIERDLYLWRQMPDYYYPASVGQAV